MSLGLVESFSEFKEFKNIDRATMMRVMEDVFRSMLKKKYGDDDNFDIIINTDQGDLEIYRNRRIVDDGEVEDENADISITDARLIEEDFEIGDILDFVVVLFNDFAVSDHDEASLCFRENFSKPQFAPHKSNRR